MEAFDNLPAPVRAALNFAVSEIPTRMAIRLLRRGASPERTAEIIRDTDLRLLRKRQGGAA